MGTLIKHSTQVTTNTWFFSAELQAINQQISRIKQLTIYSNQIITPDFKICSNIQNQAVNHSLIASHIDFFFKYHQSLLLHLHNVQWEKTCQTHCNSYLHSASSLALILQFAPHIYISISDYSLSRSRPAECKYRAPLSHTHKTCICSAWIFCSVCWKCIL